MKPGRINKTTSTRRVTSYPQRFRRWLAELFIPQHRVNNNYDLADEPRAAVFDTLSDSLFILDWKARIIDLNTTAVTAFGKELDTVAGKHIVEIIVPEILQEHFSHAFEHYLSRLHDASSPQPSELSVVKDKAGVVTVMMTITPLRVRRRALFAICLQDVPEYQQSKMQEHHNESSDMIHLAVDNTAGNEETRQSSTSSDSNESVDVRSE